MLDEIELYELLMHIITKSNIDWVELFCAGVAYLSFVFFKYITFCFFFLRKLKVSFLLLCCENGAKYCKSYSLSIVIQTRVKSDLNLASHTNYSLFKLGRIGESK